MARASAIVGGVVAVGAALAIAGGVVAWQMAKRGGSSDREERPYRHYIALDDHRALRLGGGFSSPFVVDAVERHGSSLSVHWSHSTDTNTGSHPWAWARHGDLLAGEFHAAQGEGPARLAIFDFARGHVTTLPGLSSGAFAFIDDHTVATIAENTLHLIDVTAPVRSPLWNAALAPGNFAGHVGGTDRYAAVWNGSLEIFDRANPASHRALGPMTDLVGLATMRDEALVLRDGALAVVSLANGSERVRVDLGNGQPVTDGIPDPCLLGRRGDKWLVVYSTELTNITQTNGRSFTREASKVLAGIDATSGQVVWRVPLGNWAIECVDDAFRLEIATDRERTSPLIVHGVADIEGGGALRGMFASIDIDGGALQWQHPYDDAGRGGNFIAYRGAAMYIRAGGVHSDAVLRFESGRLTGAVRLDSLTDALVAPATTFESAWLGGESWHVLAAPDLRVVGGEGDASRVRESRAWALTRFALQ